jgi:hypothetical protein
MDHIRPQASAAPRLTQPPQLRLVMLRASHRRAAACDLGSKSRNMVSGRNWDQSQPPVPHSPSTPASSNAAANKDKSTRERGTQRCSTGLRIVPAPGSTCAAEYRWDNASIAARPRSGCAASRARIRLQELYGDGGPQAVGKSAELRSAANWSSEDGRETEAPQAMGSKASSINSASA